MILGLPMALALREVTALLERLAPLEHAESWDNVGLLLEPEGDRKSPDAAPSVRRAMLTRRSHRARARRGHAARRRPARRLPSAHLRAAQAAARHGARRTAHCSSGARRHRHVLAAHGARRGARRSERLARRRGRPGCAKAARRGAAPRPDAEFKLVVFVPPEHVDALRAALSEAGAGVIGNYTECSYELAGSGTFLGGAARTPSSASAASSSALPKRDSKWSAPRRRSPRAARSAPARPPLRGAGLGRLPARPKTGAGIRCGQQRRARRSGVPRGVIERVKTHIGRSALRVARAERHANGAPIRASPSAPARAAACSTGASGHDLFLTGELRHHDVLRALARGTSVVLCEHSSSERGYLPLFAQRCERQPEAPSRS